MTVKELIQELQKIEDKDLDVIILSDNIDLTSVKDIYEDTLGYDRGPVKPCIRLR